MPEAGAPVQAPAIDLIDWVDFKWLMATEGHRVSIERLQQDCAYARACISLAMASGSKWLRLAAERLRRGMPPEPCAAAPAPA